MYVKQRNVCANLLRKVKRNYYSNLKINNITDNNKFWKSVKPSFTDKINTNEQITLIENYEIISDNHKIAETMNDVFSNVVNLLDIAENNDIVKNLENIKDPVAKAINKYSIHPSIIKIN